MALPPGGLTPSRVVPICEMRKKYARLEMDVTTFTASMHLSFSEQIQNVLPDSGSNE